MVFLYFIFLRFYLFIFREREREGEREGEKHQCVVASHLAPTGDLAHNPGMCPDWESNQRCFGSQVGTQSTKPHKPGPMKDLILLLKLIYLLDHYSFDWYKVHYACKLINMYFICENESPLTADWPMNTYLQWSQL